VWTDPFDATTYNVVRGSVANITDQGTHYDVGAVTCLEANSSDRNTTGHEDAEIPPVGQAFFYLVEYEGPEVSTYATDSADRPRIPASGACQ
jgi:hypothetical protein